MSKRLDKLIAGVLPISFIGIGFLNILAYVVGLHDYDTLRTLVVFGIIGAVALLLLGKVVLLWRDQKESRSFFLRCACIPALYAVIQIWALLTFDDKMMLFRSALVGGCYLVSACCALLIIITESGLRRFLRTCRIYAVVLAPIIIYYCVRFYGANADSSVSNLGIVDYMSLGYTLLEICVFLLLEVLLYHNDGEKVKGFFSVNYALTVLYSAAIALSGTKGAMLCLLMCILCIFAGRIFSKIKMSKRSMLMAASVCLTLLLFTTILAPGGNVGNRVLSFIEELKPSASVTVTEEERQDVLNVMEKIEADSDPADKNDEKTEETKNTHPTQPSENMGDVTDFVMSGKAYEQLQAGVITQEEYDALYEMMQKLSWTSTGARRYLWSTALDEIKSSPVLGHGPHAYEGKYGTYPHNFFLELGADFGLPVMAAVLILGLYVFFRLIQCAFTSRLYFAFTLYVLTFLPRTMISGSLYGYENFLQYGFCILLLFCPPLSMRSDRL